VVSVGVGNDHGTDRRRNTAKQVQWHNVLGRAGPHAPPKWLEFALGHAGLPSAVEEDRRLVHPQQGAHWARQPVLWGVNRLQRHAHALGHGGCACGQLHGCDNYPKNYGESARTHSERQIVVINL
jgi:hypothetical protein